MVEEKGGELGREEVEVEGGEVETPALCVPPCDECRAQMSNGDEGTLLSFLCECVEKGAKACTICYHTRSCQSSDQTTSSSHKQAAGNKRLKDYLLFNLS